MPWNSISRINAKLWSKPEYRVARGILTTGLFYLLAVRIGRILVIPELSAAPVWFASGVAIAGIMLFGRWAVLGVPLGALISFAIGDTLLPSNSYFVLIVVGGNMLEALLGAYFIERICGKDCDWMAAPFPALRFCLLCLVIPIVGSIAIVMLGSQLATVDVNLTAATWWTGNVVGLLIVVPLAKTLTFHKQVVVHNTYESFLFWMSLAIVLFMVYPAVGILLPIRLRVSFLLAIVLGWGAIRLTRLQVGLGLALSVIVVTAFSLRDYGPFAISDLADDLISMEFFLTSMSIVIWLLSTLGYRLREYQDDLELMVAEQTSELRIRTADQAAATGRMENYISIVAHDIRAPFRRMRSTVQIIQEECGQLAGECGDLLKRVISIAIQGEDMVTALVNYSRLNVALTIVEIDTRALLESIIEDVSFEYKVPVEVGKVPEMIRGDIDLIRQLLYNLISNAAKFSSLVYQPLVKVYGERDKTSWMMTVEDNGAGIPIDAQDFIFGVFKRAHTQEEYPGTGIGLAITKRVIDLHKGDIWFESAPNQRTAFHVRIPA